MGQKLVIPGISEEKGFEEIDKEDWVPLLVEGDTILLSNINNEKQKIWVMADLSLIHISEPTRPY